MNLIKIKMILRNGKVIGETVYYRKTQYQVIIDFDYASKMWRQNKIYLGNGMFKYKRTRTR
jgi:hypothetical protein